MRHSTSSRTSLFYNSIIRVVSPILLVSQLCVYNVFAQKFPCNDTVECEKLVGAGSTCLHSKASAYCSNPYEQGCLYHLLPDWNKKRVCNSDDPVNASDLGICRLPDIEEYLEIRIFSENWESISFISWILQIILSELLGVPTTLETGTPLAKKNLYDPMNSFDYGGAFPMQAEALETAATVGGGDCSRVKYTNDNSDYKSCAHILPETWDQLYSNNITYVEDDRALGANGQEGWFITKFTAERYPSLVSYLGLQGEQNREQLANLFLRPTTWLEYCEQVSTNNCTQGGDAVAKRPPKDASEASRMFMEDEEDGTLLFTGHFRKTEENDCDKFPLTCTGHIADYPCGWSSNTQQQAHYLNIALKSSGKNDLAKGYTHTQMVDMWKAANATKSHLMMVWWTPEPLVQTFSGTEAEFQRVLLPAATQTCSENKVGPSKRCNESLGVRIGDPLGACDYIPQTLYKRISTGLHDAIYDPSIPEAIQSPAYNVLQSFSLNELQFGELFDAWKSKRTAREAICQWGVDNIDYLRSFVPRSYPRVVQREVSQLERGLQTLALVLGGITTLLVLATIGAIYAHRYKRNIRIAQIEFLWILLAGLLLISIGATVNGMERTNTTCIVSIWFIYVGFTLELVPLIVKVAAINHMAVAAKKLRRVTIDRKSLYRVVAILFLFIIMYLLVWTIMDPPNKVPEYDLLLLSESNSNNSDATVVSMSYSCSSESELWRYAAVGWICILLLCATVLAYQMRNLVKDFNESWTLAMMIYSHLMFVVLRVITFLLSDHVSRSLLQQLQSYIYCLDVTVTVVLYFLPKFFCKEDESRTSISYDSQLSARAFELQNNSQSRSMRALRLSNNGRINYLEDSKCNGTNSKVHPGIFDSDDFFPMQQQQQQEKSENNSNDNSNDNSNEKQDQQPTDTNSTVICCPKCGTEFSRCTEETKNSQTKKDDEDEA